MNSNISSCTLELDCLQTRHTQVLVNIVSSALYSKPLDNRLLKRSLLDLCHHLDACSSYNIVNNQSHCPTATNIIEVLEHILICWVCARAEQEDNQNYSLKGMVVVAPDSRFDKYADIPVETISAVALCISNVTRIEAGIIQVAKSSIPSSLALALNFSDNPKLLTSVFRTLTTLCTKRSGKKLIVGGCRWHPYIGLSALLEAFTQAQNALRQRNRFDGLANVAFTLAMELVPLDTRLRNHPTGSDPKSINSSFASLFIPKCVPTTDAKERTLISALSLINVIADAYIDAKLRLKVRGELLDTPLYQCLKLLENPAFDSSIASYEARKFRRAYSQDIRKCDPAKVTVTNQIQ